MHAVYLCNPLNNDMDHRIFNIPTFSFHACIYLHVLFSFTYAVRQNGFLFSREEGGGGGEECLANIMLDVFACKIGAGVCFMDFRSLSLLLQECLADM